MSRSKAEQMEVQPVVLSERLLLIADSSLLLRLLLRCKCDRGVARVPSYSNKCTGLGVSAGRPLPEFLGCFRLSIASLQSEEGTGKRHGRFCSSTNQVRFARYRSSETFMPQVLGRLIL